MAKRKKKTGRKPLRVKIKGNPLPLIDFLLSGKGGSFPKRRPKR